MAILLRKDAVWAPKVTNCRKTSYTAGVHALGDKHDVLEEFVSKGACLWGHLRPREAEVTGIAIIVTD